MQAKFAAMEEFIQEHVGRTKLAGFSLALVEGGEVVYQRGFGLRDLERGLPATPQTLYGIGSITKSATCIALLQLQERGLLCVDDPVDRYLPLRVRPFGETIRLHHLMSHTSGIPALAYAEQVLRQKHGAVDTYLPMGGVEDMLTFVNGAADWVQTRPGERWFYLNEGYALLGAIIEQVSGKPYTEYVTEHILRPLGMNRSFFGREQVSADVDLAVPYALDRMGNHLPCEYTFGQVTADGGLISSATDMARYVTMFLKGGRGPNGALISPESLRAMMTPVVPTPAHDPRSGEPAGHYCWGLSTWDLFGQRAVGHGGSVLIATANMSFLPERGLGAIALTNGSGYPTANVTAFALAVLLGEDPWQLPALQAERALTDLTGVYETYRGTHRTTVRRQGDFLMLAFKTNHSEESIPLYPADLHAGTFHTLSGGRRLTAEFRQRGGDMELLYERYKFRRTGRLAD